MLFNEKEYKNFKRKIEIDMSFVYDYHDEEDVKVVLNICYDSGNGIQFNKLDEETTLFATKLCNGKLRLYRDYFKPLYDNPYLSILDYNNRKNTNNNVISNEKNRQIIARELTSFANKMYVPVFLHTNNNYLLLNADKIIQVEDEMNLSDYLKCEYQNDEYESAKKSRQKSSVLRKML